MDELTFMCCFCGKGIEGDPVKLTVKLGEGQWQFLAAHGGCLAKLSETTVGEGLLIEEFG